MADDFKDYEVKGEYTWNTTGSFFGNFRIYNDGRLIGAMNDSGSDIIFNRGATKVAIGTADSSNIHFLKFSPHPATAPLIYSMRGSDGQFNGNWTTVEIPIQFFIQGGVEGFKPLPELWPALNAANFVQAIEILSAIEQSRITGYLRKDIIKKVRLSSYTSRLSLEEISSFTF